MARPTKLTPEVHTKILSYIRAGAFDWVAAQACGIHPRQFYHWMSKGNLPDSPAWYRQFRQDVLHARAEARVLAEAEVRRDNAFAWLRYGPGRDRPGEPGWTESVIVEPGEPLVVRIEYADRDHPTAAPAPVTGNGDRRTTPV